MDSNSNEEESIKKKHEVRRTTMLLNFHFGVTLSTSMLAFPARVELLKLFCRDDSAKMAKILAGWGFGAGFFEFMLNPTLGKLSDAYGRKPFMLLSPLSGLILKAWVAAKPSLLSLTVEKVVCDGLRSFSGTTMVGAAFSDALTDSDLAMAFGNLESYAGFAVMTMPLLASALTRFTGSLRAPFLVSALLCVAQLHGTGSVLKETLPTTSMKQFHGFINPLECLRLFAISPALSFTCAMLVLQWLVEPKNLSDVMTLTMMNDLKLSNERFSLITSVSGLGIALSGPLTSASLSALGERGHTTVTQMISAFCFTLRGLFVSETTIWFLMPLYYYAETRLATTKALATNIAISTGRLGKGEFGGLQANLRAFVTAMAPLLYSALYRAGIKVGQPGRPSLFAAVAMVVAELIHRKLRALQLTLKSS